MNRAAWAAQKRLLPIDGQTFIERIVGALKQGGIERIVVVLGFEAEELGGKSPICRWRYWSIPTIDLGQLSSLQVALRHLEFGKSCAA